jgi:hypothetical protein
MQREGRREWDAERGSVRMTPKDTRVMGYMGNKKRKEKKKISPDRLFFFVYFTIPLLIKLRVRKWLSNPFLLFFFLNKLRNPYSGKMMIPSRMGKCL